MFIDNGLTQAQIRAGKSLFKAASEGRGGVVSVRPIAQCGKQWFRIKAKRSQDATAVRVIANECGQIVAIMRRDRMTYDRVEDLYRRK